MEFGILGGVNIFTFGGSDASGAKSRTSFFAGASLTVPLSSSFYVQPEALYSDEGASADLVVDTVTVHGAIKLAYLEVPVLLGVNLTPSARTGLRIFAGPAVGLKLSCSVAATIAGLTSSQSCPSDFAKSTDFGVTGGAGLTMHMTKFNVNVDARYTLGLAKVLTGGDIKNQGFSIGAGLSFPLGRK